MKNFRKKVLLKVLTGVSATCLIVAGLGVYLSTNKNSVDNDLNANLNGDSEIIKNEGIEIKFLKEITNEDGSITKTFTYEVSPSNATNQDVNVTFKYENGEDCSDVITYSKNIETKEISITCHKDFATKIILTLTAVNNPKAYLEMAIHYEKKLLLIDMDYQDLTYGDQFMQFDQELLYKPIYSQYTKDKNYTFEIDIIDFTYYDGLGQFENFQDLFAEKIVEMISEESEWTAEMWWNLSENNQWHSALLEYDSNDIVYGKLLYKVKCNETNMVSDEFLCSFYIPLAMDYSNFEVLVDSLQTSDVELVF